MIAIVGENVQKQPGDHRPCASCGPVEAQDHKYTSVLVQS